MRNFLALFLIFCLCIFIGCLGMGGGGTSGVTGDPVSPGANALLSGRVYFADRQLYGNIPVAARNQAGVLSSTVLTDTAGNYAFTSLPAGTYDLVALTGESEVIFARAVTLDGITAKQMTTTPLLGIRSFVVDEISSTSFHLEFRTNRACRASIEYGPLGGYQQIKTIGQAGQTLHEATISGLKTYTDYEITLFLTGDDGQEFVMHGLSAATTGAVGPTGLSVAINDGAYETRSKSVTLTLASSNSTHMRIGESYDLADASWVTFSPTYSYTFKEVTDGTKRIYVQFRDNNNLVSPVQSDAILITQSGYVGIWINDGDASTSSTDAVIKTIFPGATQMQLSDSVSFLYSFWEPYTASKRWKFSAVDGQKTIYCRFQGGLANPTEVFTASILLDTTPPQVEMKINAGSTVTATTSVTITFSFSFPPSHMKLSNTTVPATASSWLPFSDTVSWVLPTGDDEKEVYGIFRDSAGNEYGPISAKIELDSVAPIGNKISILISDDSASDPASYTLIASLPVFLHLDAADATTFKAYYAIGKTSRPTSYTSVPKPFAPVQLTEEMFKGTQSSAVGTYTVWVYFTDEAGNAGYDQTVKIKIDGPEISISPSSVSLISGGNQQFVASTRNIDAQDVGAIKWEVLPGDAGTIDSTGLYVAPSPVYYASKTTIIARSEKKADLRTEAFVNLATSVEILFQQPDGKFTYDAVDGQVTPGASVTALIKVLHSDRVYEVNKQPAFGTVSLSQPASASFGTVATLTYIAPQTAPAVNPVTIGIRALEKRSVAATLTYLISTGANISLTPTTGEAQRNNPLTLSATVAGTASTTMIWTISPSGMGSFAPDSISSSVETIYPDHRVTFYASSPSQIQQASVTASIGGASKKCNITVYPPIQFRIDPSATSSMPIIGAMTFKIPGFDYLLGNASEAVTWEFKNTARVDFMPADGKTYMDRGSLTIVNATTAEFKRPSALPSIADPTAADSVIIRATSVADPTASATAIATITPKVVVEIFNTVEKVAPIATAATVAEVGKIQFFAGVTPTVIGDTSVSWTVNGTTGSDQYGQIDANGLYTAPDLIVVNEITVKAASNYDPTAFAEVVVSLNDFWLPRRSNMFDNTTGEPMQVTSLLVNPYTATNTAFTVYAGTSGYGAWVATFSDTPGDVSGGYWQPFNGLSAQGKSNLGQYNIGHLVISPNQDVYAGTADGIWYLPQNGDPAARIVGDSPGNNLPNENFLKLSFDNKNPQYLFATTPRGVYKITMTGPQTTSGWLKVLNTTDYYKSSDRESRINSTASPPITVEAYSNIFNTNPIDGALQTIAYDDYNDRLYAGGEGGVFLYLGDTTRSNLLQITASAFVANAPSTATALETFFILSTNQPRRSPTGVGVGADVFPPLDMAIDIVNRNTIWAATVGGVHRSVDNGMTWALKAFTEGSNVNCRAIIIDPTNTINVLAGSEDGLYRTTDAGGTWKRIKSGLGNHKTITSLIQAAGIAGARRKVWVGTAGGVFLGKQSLDLE